MKREKLLPYDQGKTDYRNGLALHPLKYRDANDNADYELGWTTAEAQAARRWHG